MNKIVLGGIDTTVADIVIALSVSDNALKALVEFGKTGKFALNDKAKITDKEYLALSAHIADYHKEPSAGGTVANIFHALISIFGKDKMAGEIVSLPGIRKNGRVVRDEAKKSGINIAPDLPISEADEINTPVSYIFINDLSETRIRELEEEHKCALPFLYKHKKFVLRNDGSGIQSIEAHEDKDAAEIPTESINIILRDTIRSNAAKSDVTFLTGSTTRKFSLDTFRADLNYAMQNNKPVVFILPTHDKITPQEAKLYWQAMKYAKLIVGNKNELRNTYRGIREAVPETAGHSKLDKGHAIRDLRKQLNNALKQGRQQMAFITDDDQPVTILYPDARKKSCLKIEVNPIDIPKQDIKSSLGAGDNTIAAFIAAILKGFSPRDAGRIAMRIAEVVLKIMPAQIPEGKKEFDDAVIQTGSHPLAHNRFKDIILGSQAAKSR